MHEVLTDGIWLNVAKRANAAANRKVAIAYVTIDEFGLRDGDVLVTDASPRAIKSGQTDAKLLRRLERDGVAIHSRPGLHCKVALFGSYAVVGSANMSGSGLIEAAVITDDPVTASGIAAFIRRLATKSTRLDEKAIATLCAIEVERTGGFRPLKPKSPVRRLGKSTWLVGVKGLKSDPNEKTQARIDKRNRELNMRHDTDDDYAWIQWGKKSRFGRESRAGDTLLEIYRPHAGGRATVTRRVRIVLKDHEPVFNRLYTDEPTRAVDTVGWTRFKRILKAAGYADNISVNSVRKLDPKIADEIDRLWTRTR
jgi:hypothetical protein